MRGGATFGGNTVCKFTKYFGTQNLKFYYYSIWTDKCKYGKMKFYIDWLACFSGHVHLSILINHVEHHSVGSKQKHSHPIQECLSDSQLRLKKSLPITRSKYYKAFYSIVWLESTSFVQLWKILMAWLGNIPKSFTGSSKTIAKNNYLTCKLLQGQVNICISIWNMNNTTIAMPGVFW